MNITDMDACPKCTGEDLMLKYDPTLDRIRVTCPDCGYTCLAECADNTKEIEAKP
jgi:transposase-like protein